VTSPDGTADRHAGSLHVTDGIDSTDRTDNGTDTTDKGVRQ
jgi:hypothetical protein